MQTRCLALFPFTSRRMVNSMVAAPFAFLGAKIGIAGFPLIGKAFAVPLVAALGVPAVVGGAAAVAASLVLTQGDSNTGSPVGVNPQSGRYSSKYPRPE